MFANWLTVIQKSSEASQGLVLAMEGQRSSSAACCPVLGLTIYVELLGSSHALILPVLLPLPIMQEASLSDRQAVLLSLPSFLSSLILLATASNSTEQQRESAREVIKCAWLETVGGWDSQAVDLLVKQNTVCWWSLRRHN